MIYEHIAFLWLFFYLMSFSTVYTIQTHSFYFLFPSCINLLTFENESKSVNILICSFIKVHRGTQISYILQFFHEHRI